MSGINRVNTKLAMLAAMAVEMRSLPASSRDVVNQPAVARRAGKLGPMDFVGSVKPAFVHPKDRKPNTNGLNRKLRRKLASMAAHGKLNKSG